MDKTLKDRCNSEIDKILKNRLIVISFLPLVFLLLISHWDCASLEWISFKISEIIRGDSIVSLFKCSIFYHFVMMVACVFFLALGLIYMYIIKLEQGSGFTETDKIVIQTEQTETGLNFFVTYLYPMLTKVESLRDMLFFIFLMAIIVELLKKTTLFYQNPVLTMLGYKIFSFKFSGKPDVRICITYGNLDKNNVFKYKKISDHVYFVYNVKRSNCDKSQENKRFDFE